MIADDVLQDKVKYFIADVTEHIVERHLLGGLAEDTLSPFIVNDLEEDEVAQLAAEDDNITFQREGFEHNLTILEEGRKALSKVAGGFR